jgi:hypothetical protein
LKAGVRECFELLLDGTDDLRMLMAGVDDGDARCKVDVALAVLAPDLGVFRLLGIDSRGVTPRATALARRS